MSLKSKYFNFNICTTDDFKVPKFSTRYLIFCGGCVKNFYDVGIG